MHYLITGGTGFIGSAFIQSISPEHQITVLTRKRNYKNKNNKNINYVNSLQMVQARVDVVINLAGEPLDKSRWSKKQKARIIDSRVDTTQQIVAWIEEAEHKPTVFISGSAIGYYGPWEDSFIDEAAEPHASFSSYLCRQWEQAAQVEEKHAVRVCLIRIGLVLDKPGGLLKKLYLPVKTGSGTILGEGNQGWSWIHREDLIRLIHWLIERQTLIGPINAVAPKPVTQARFMHTFAAVLNRKIRLRLPSWVVKLLFGEMAELLLTGQRVVPKKLIDSGFEFKHTDLEQCLQNIYLD